MTVRRKLAVVAGWLAALAVGPGAAPAWAHGGPGAAADSMTTLLLLIGAALGLSFRRRRKRPATSGARWQVWLLVPAAIAAVALGLTAGRWAPQAKPSANRPTTAGRLAILAPAQDATTGPDVTLRLDLVGATLAPAGSTRLLPTEGHVHLYVDGRLTSMSDGLSEEIKGLPPGPHVVRAEFVASDHAPFKNPVVAAVRFDVAG